MIRAALEAISLWAIPVLLVLIPLAGRSAGQGLRRLHRGGQGRIRRRGQDHPVPGRDSRRHRHVPRFGRDGAATSALRRRCRHGLPCRGVPVALLRPLSGSGTLALTSELIKTNGADSFIARTAATMYGSTETTFYVLAVYFGAVGVRRTRHAVPAALIGDVVAAIAAVAVCAWMF